MSFRILNFLDVKDLYNSNIILNSKLVHLVDMNTLQIEKDFLNKYPDNKVYLLVKKSPERCNTTDDFNDQLVDLPMSLLEALVYGMAMYAHSSGIISQESGTYQSGVNPFAKRYEEAIEKAIANQFIYPQGTEYLDVQKRGYV